MVISHLFDASGLTVASLGAAPSSGHPDNVTLDHGHGLDAVLGPEFLAQRGRHQLSPDVRRSLEVTLAVLPPGGAHVWVELHPLLVQSLISPPLDNRALSDPDFESGAVRLTASHASHVAGQWSGWSVLF